MADWQIISIPGTVGGVDVRLSIWDHGQIVYACPAGEPNPFVAVPGTAGTLEAFDSLRRHRPAPDLEPFIQEGIAAAREAFGPDWGKE